MKLYLLTVASCLLWFCAGMAAGNLLHHTNPQQILNIEHRSVLLGKMDAMAAQGIEVCDLYYKMNALPPNGFLPVDPEFIEHLTKACKLVTTEN